MFERIKALLLDSGGGAEASEKSSRRELELAAAALLVEAALMDGNFDVAEREKVAHLLEVRFALAAAEAETLIEDAINKIKQSPQLYGFTRVVKDRFDHDDRVELMEMLWEVAYADGELHDFESNLMRRIAGLIYVSDRESGAARKRVLERLETGQTVSLANRREPT